jgi:2-amino-4-ketopentanoate thiolase alpha subunit
MIFKGTIVQIKKTILEPEERAQNIPNDTKKVPFLMWIKGKLVNDTLPGEVVTIETQTNRIETGTLVSIEPYYTHNFGEYVSILQEIKDIITSETEDLL